MPHQCLLVGRVGIVLFDDWSIPTPARLVSCLEGTSSFLHARGSSDRRSWRMPGSTLPVPVGGVAQSAPRVWGRQRTNPPRRRPLVLTLRAPRDRCKHRRCALDGGGIAARAKASEGPSAARAKNHAPQSKRARGPERLNLATYIY